jgi:quercetin dioxygenase-like cupin family protein
MKKPLVLSLFAATAGLAFAAGAAFEKSAHPAPLESCILRKADAKKSSGAWGSIALYTRDETVTAGTDSLLTAELEFLPGQQLQPPHQHPNEECQYVISGTGTWFLNGKEIPLETGDLMYTKPGDLHGIKNTGTEPLRFFVFKWISRGEAKPN